MTPAPAEPDTDPDVPSTAGLAASAEALSAQGRRRPREPRPRWYRQQPAALVRLDCGGERHTVRWHKGRLVLLDHDVAAETVLMALGAERPACLTFYDRWKAIFAGGGAPGPSRAPRPSRGPAAAPLRTAVSAGRDLRSFGADLSRVVELAQLVRAERRWADPDLPASDRQRLVDTYLAQLRTAFAASLQPSSRQRGRQQLALHARPLPSGEEAAAEVITGPGRIEVDLQLPLSWVIEVGGRGLGDIPGRMVLAVVDADHERSLLGVSGIVWQVQGPGRVVAQLERWWTTRTEAGWELVDGARPVRRGASLWWSTSQR